MKIKTGRKYRLARVGIVLIIGKDEDGVFQAISEATGTYLPIVSGHELSEI